MNQQTTKKPSTASEVRSILLIVLLALFIRTFLLELFYVPTGSMKETILEGDYIFSTKYNYGFSRYSLPFSPNLFSGRILSSEPEIGDVIIIRPPHNMDERYIKRLVGMPGDKIQIIDNVLYINDQAVKREYKGEIIDNHGNKLYRFKETLPNNVSYFSYKADKPINIPHIDHNNFGPYYVEEGRYFFLGDNRDSSGDGRYQLGTVPFENFIAKGHFIIFSSSIALWDANLSISEQLYRIWTWFTSIRVKRLFKPLYE